MSVGIIDAGERHDFGVVGRKEMIRVTSGAIKINDKLFQDTGTYCDIEPGTQVIFEAIVLSSYICFFPGETR